MFSICIEEKAPFVSFRSFWNFFYVTSIHNKLDRTSRKLKKPNSQNSILSNTKLKEFITQVGAKIETILIVLDRSKKIGYLRFQMTGFEQNKYSITVFTISKNWLKAFKESLKCEYVADAEMDRVRLYWWAWAYLRHTIHQSQISSVEISKWTKST